MLHPGDETAARVAAILADARFPQARQSYIDGYLELYSGDPALNKLLAESARHVIITFVICLAAAQRDDDPETWLTLAKLQSVVTAHQVGSPGLVESIVSRMIDRDLLTSTPVPADRRKRILAPTPRLLAHDRDLIVAQAVPCAIVMDSPAVASAVACSSSFQVRLRAAAVAAFADAMALLGRHPAMLQISMRDSGLMVLFALLQGAYAPGPNSSTGYQAIADRFGVSRTHVRELVVEAEAAGLMRGHGGGGTAVEVLPPLREATDRFIADAMALFADCCQKAYAAPSA